MKLFYGLICLTFLSMCSCASVPARVLYQDENGGAIEVTGTENPRGEFRTVESLMHCDTARLVTRSLNVYTYECTKPVMTRLDRRQMEMERLRAEIRRLSIAKPCEVTEPNRCLWKKDRNCTE